MDVIAAPNPAQAIARNDVWAIKVEGLAKTVNLADYVREGGVGLRLDAVQEVFGAEFTLQVHKEFEIEPFCPCTEEGVLRALSSLGREGLESLYLEGRDAEMFCEFCRKRYVVSQLQIQDLLNEAEEAEIMGKEPEEPTDTEPELPGEPEKE